MRPDKQGRKHRPRLFMRILAFIISVSMLLSNLAFGAVSTVNAAENAAVETYVGQKATASDAERTVEKATGSNASPSDALFDEDGFLKDGEVEPEIKEYMITLDGNGGKVYDSDQYTMTLSENDLFWALPEATWEDHYFTGWYEDPECTEGIERGDTPSEDMILYAGWTQENVTVTYVSSSVLLTDDGENYSNEIVKE